MWTRTSPNPAPVGPGPGATSSAAPHDDLARAAGPGEPVVLGVCAPLAVRLGVSVAVLRAATIVLAVTGGFGLLVYVLTASVWRNRATPPSIEQQPRAGRDLGVALVTLGVVWDLGNWWPGIQPALVIPTALVAAGVALGWRSPSVDGEPHAGDGGRPRLGSVVARVAAGMALCIGGLAVFLGQRVDVGTLRDTGLAVAVALGGVAVVLGPTLVRFARSLGEERSRRIRVQERAAVAAHLHDSVLQTLTLIQKRADDPAATAALARHEERSLRRWLYGSGVPDTDPERGWRDAAEQLVGEVEDLHAVAVELVMVGDGPMTTGVAALLAAAREALVNAAKFSGVAQVSMFCEWTDDQLSVFVRDRGVGFDLSTVDGDRHGISDSIIGRVRRAGGQAIVRTAPGEGTEVILTVRVS